MKHRQKKLAIKIEKLLTEAPPTSKMDGEDLLGVVSLCTAAEIASDGRESAIMRRRLREISAVGVGLDLPAPPLGSTSEPLKVQLSPGYMDWAKRRGISPDDGLRMLQASVSALHLLSRWREPESEAIFVKGLGSTYAEISYWSIMGLLDSPKVSLAADICRRASSLPEVNPGLIRELENAVSVPGQKTIRDAIRACLARTGSGQ